MNLDPDALDRALRALPPARPGAAHLDRVRSRAASAFVKAHARPRWLTPIVHVLDERIVPAAAVAFASMYLFWAFGEALG